MNQSIYATKLTETKLTSPSQFKHSGLLLRDHRLKLGLTLSEASLHICTSSYLSRLEKGTASPTPAILKKLSKRLHITSTTEQTITKDWISPFRLALHQHDLKLLERLINNSLTTYHYQKILQIFVFDVINQKTSELKLNHDYLLLFQDYMTLEELQLFYHYVGTYYENEANPELSLHYFRLALRLNRKNPQQDGLLFLSLAKHYFKHGNPNRGIHHLQDALSLFTDELFIKYKIDCELLLCYYYVKSHIYSKAKPLLHKLHYLLKFNDPYEQYPSYLLVLGGYYLETNRYLEAEKRYQQALRLNPHRLEGILCLLELYHHSKDVTKQCKFIEQLELKAQSLPKSLIIQMNYYKFLYQESLTESFRLFLQKEAIPDAIQTANFNYYYYYSCSLIEYYEKVGKYKLALKLYQELKNKRCLTPFMN